MGRSEKEMKEYDVIRDFTENDPDMKNLWIIGGKNYVLYRIIHVGKHMVNAVRASSPSHPAGTESIYKNFVKSDLSRPTQTRGIYELH